MCSQRHFGGGGLRFEKPGSHWVRTWARPVRPWAWWIADFALYKERQIRGLGWVQARLDTCSNLGIWQNLLTIFEILKFSVCFCEILEKTADASCKVGGAKSRVKKVEGAKSWVQSRGCKVAGAKSRGQSRRCKVAGAKSAVQSRRCNSSIPN